MGCGQSIWHSFKHLSPTSGPQLAAATITVGCPSHRRDGCCGAQNGPFAGSARTQSMPASWRVRAMMSGLGDKSCQHFVSAQPLEHTSKSRYRPLCKQGRGELTEMHTKCHDNASGPGQPRARHATILAANASMIPSTSHCGAPLSSVRCSIKRAIALCMPLAWGAGPSAGRRPLSFQKNLLPLARRWQGIRSPIVAKWHAKQKARNMVWKSRRLKLDWRSLGWRQRFRLMPRMTDTKEQGSACQPSDVLRYWKALPCCLRSVMLRPITISHSCPSSTKPT